MKITKDQKVVVDRVNAILLDAVEGMLKAQLPHLEAVGLTIEEFNLNLLVAPTEAPAPVESDEDFLRKRRIMPDLTISGTEHR
jgi:hypothetical protein